MDLLGYPDVRVRLRAIEALGSLGAVESGQFLEHVAAHDKNDEVRRMATTMLKSLKTDGAAVD